MHLDLAMGAYYYNRDLKRPVHEIRRREEPVAAWQSGAPTPLGFMITMEGADGIIAPDDLPAWYDDGLRVIGLVHYGQGRYAGGTSAPTGLTDLGRALLRRMDEVGMIL